MEQPIPSEICYNPTKRGNTNPPTLRNNRIFMKSSRILIIRAPWKCTLIISMRELSMRQQYSAEHCETVAQWPCKQSAFIYLSVLLFQRSTVNYLIHDYFCLRSMPVGTRCLKVNYFFLWSRIRGTDSVYCSKQPFKHNNVSTWNEYFCSTFAATVI